MELTIKEIDRISKEFKIHKQEILDFLAEEERLMQIEIFKNLFTKNQNPEKITEQWLSYCRNFGDYEEFYVIVNKNFITENFFFDWMTASKNYKERREVYACAKQEKPLITKALLKKWIDQAEKLEDIREAMKHLEPNSDDYKIGTRKIINIYKS
jgi:Mg2+ and Co2+ transporter CorA